MMISFGWTSEALIARQKHCTRRKWKASHAGKFKKGTVADAWNRLCWLEGARRIGKIELTQDPVIESMHSMPDDDYIHEGFQWLDQNGILPGHFKKAGFDNLMDFFECWRAEGEWVYVVRFKILEIYDVA